MRLLPLLTLVGSALAALPFKGADWSSLLIEEKAGKTYKNSAGVVQPLETILKNSGVNTVRQRIWVNPSDGNYNLAYNIALGKRAKAAGLNVYLDFHYSDTWADPGHQTKPAAWNALSDTDLVAKIYSYTKSVCDEFQKNNIPLSIVSIGNEITVGLLFPTGNLDNANGPKNAAALLTSASNAVKQSTLTAKPKIMLHTDNGWKWSTQKWWYDTLHSAGLSPSAYDIQGLSYYPFYSPDALLASLSDSMKNMAQTYKKDVMVVETNWPTYCPNPKFAFPADTKDIPLSPAGQTKWLQTVAARVAAVPGGKGTGLFYWEPAWIDNAGLGSSCGFNLMFDNSGKVMESLAAFKTI